MKIRQGFVSNSSSSNFIVGFFKGKVPSTAAAVKKLLFKGRDIIQPYDDTITSDQAAEDIIGQMENQKPMTFDEFVAEVDDSPGQPDESNYPDMKYEQKETAEQRRKREAAYELYSLECQKAKVDWVETMLEKHDDKVFYLFSYSDNEGHFGSCMEHGDVFDKAPFHLRISHH